MKNYSLVGVRFGVAGFNYLLGPHLIFGKVYVRIRYLLPDRSPQAGVIIREKMQQLSITHICTITVRVFHAHHGWPIHKTVEMHT